MASVPSSIVASAILLLSTSACGAAPTPAARKPDAPATSAPHTGAQPNRVTSAWAGHYRYEFNDGANASGTPVTVSYSLDLTPSSCRFAAEGYQTDEAIVCTARADGSTTTIAFKSYADGQTTDKYGNAVYSVGDPLFSLERTGGKVLTRWMGYPLPDEKPHPKGVYFTR